MSINLMYPPNYAWPHYGVCPGCGRCSVCGRPNDFPQWHWNVSTTSTMPIMPGVADSPAAPAEA